MCIESSIFIDVGWLHPAGGSSEKIWHPFRGSMENDPLAACAITDHCRVQEMQYEVQSLHKKTLKRDHTHSPGPLIQGMFNEPSDRYLFSLNLVPQHLQ
jgi:hypothetical protein